MGDPDREKKEKEKKEKDSSVIFSLQELMGLEAERVDEDDRRREQERLENQQAKMQAEFRIRAAEEGRRRENEARRRAEEGALREEEARHEALRLAAIEGARVQAEQNARLALLHAAHQHEQQIVAIKTDRDKTRYKRLTTVSSLVFTLGTAASLGWYFGVMQPEQRSAQRALEQDIVRAEASAKAAQEQSEATERRIAELEIDVSREKDGARRAILQDQLNTLKPKPTGTSRVVPPPPPPLPGVPCDKKDPMAECL